MVEAFARNCPPPAKIGNQAIPEKKVAKAFDALYAEAASFSLEKKLGIIGRARFAKVLQEELLRQKYPEDLISRIVGAVTANALAAPGRQS